MTPARAAGIRAECIEGKRLSRKEDRGQQEAAKEAEAGKWTIERLWKAYTANNPNLKGYATYKSAYNLHLKQVFGNREPRDIFPLDIQRVKNNLLKKRAPQTVQHVLELLRRIINFRVNNKLCQSIDFKIEMPKFKQRFGIPQDEKLKTRMTIADIAEKYDIPMQEMIEFFELRFGEYPWIKDGFKLIVENTGPGIK